MRGNARSAPIDALTKNDAMPRPTPCRSLNACLWRSRSAMTADMSTSLKVVSIAAVLCASTRRLRDRRAALRHADALFGAVAGAAAAISATGGAGCAVRRGRRRLAARTRAAVRRCRRPPARRRGASRARRRRCPARGSDRHRVPAPPFAPSASSGSSRLAAVLARTQRPRPALRGAAAPLRRRRATASSITPSTSPTFTSSPSLRSIRFNTPACGAATSRSILSVSSSTSGSPTRHDVPFLAQPLRHARIDDRFTDFRHDDIGWHQSMHLSAVVLDRAVERRADCLATVLVALCRCVEPLRWRTPDSTSAC